MVASSFPRQIWPHVVLSKAFYWDFILVEIDWRSGGFVRVLFAKLHLLNAIVDKRCNFMQRKKLCDTFYPIIYQENEQPKILMIWRLHDIFSDPK